MEATPLYPHTPTPDDNGSVFLTTGGVNDPLLPKLIDAINRAREIAITVAFIRMSGLQLLFGALSDAVERGATLKVLTSDYLDETDPQALRELMLLRERNADIRIYQCDGQQSFHMKSYIFVHMDNGQWLEGSAFVGSSNISKAALVTGHEWNLKLSCRGTNDDIYVQQFSNICQQFHDIFHHPQVSPLSHPWIDSYISRRKKQQLIAVDPEAFTEAPTPSNIQIEALQALHNSRLADYQRGLVVLATGLGKTWLAAFDTRQFKAKRILFVAHREEILLQAQKAFTRILPKAHVGFYNGKERTANADLLFASVQTLGRHSHLKQFASDHFDYIVVDEFHHAHAATYRNILSHFSPGFLLGLTATPERTDQADILNLCDNNLVFERNLIIGINSGLLAPFHYYGIEDKHVDYDEIPWRSGKFSIDQLTHAFASKKRARHILNHWQEKRQQRTLAFCISQRHAEFMASEFKTAGYRAEAVYNGSELRRHEALSQLEHGELDVLFSVDLFNEGTDLPAIDTVLMLRPTESKILFLQQLGRGLRLHHQKTHLVVIDFIGNHKSFLIKPVALHNGHSFKQLAKQITTGSAELPDGCFVNYEPTVIDLLNRLARQQKDSIEDEYQTLKTLLDYRPTATEFYHYLNEIQMPFSRVGQQHNSWFQLVANQQDLTKQEAEVLQRHGDYLRSAIEKTAMAKSFKMILLSAFLDLDGFDNPPTTEQLAEKSWHHLKRRPDLFTKDLPENKQTLTADSKAWHKYWLGNPIKFYSNKDNDPFVIDSGRFVCKEKVLPQHKATLHQMMQELVELRIAMYINRG
ncbi:DEAD/DEAH box helicase family protein [Endozoicomonas sp. ALC013]|uniref:DEAD/DEAH box helicase family protein n=1 Tax=Endozoicomonas sp. ALC013 TaxID=3403076 RepID=UPI003BB4BC9F